jgi:hypothetical protein
MRARGAHRVPVRRRRGTVRWRGTVRCRGTVRWRRVVTMTVAAALPLTVVAAAAKPATHAASKPAITSAPAGAATFGALFRFTLTHRLGYRPPALAGRAAEGPAARSPRSER